MKNIILLLCCLYLSCLTAQPTLVNSTPVFQEVSSVAYDSINNKVFYNISHGCPTWNIPCALSYTPSLNNLINKYDFSDNSFNNYLKGNLMVGPPSFPVVDFNASISKQTQFRKNAIYTNFGYYFNKVDTTSLSTIWSYSTSSALQEISAFVNKGDSVFLFQRDSSSTKNYYTVFLKNALTGSNLPYSSLSSNNPANSLGAIEGYIKNAILINNRIVLSGVFTASVSGNFVARNLIALNIASGQLQAPPFTFLPNTSIYDLQLKSNKLYVAGRFTSANGKTRKNFAVLDTNLYLLNDTLQFDGSLSLLGSWVDNIVFYENYVIAKGYYNKIDGTQTSATSNYCIKVIDMITHNVMPWPITLPSGSPSSNGYTFQMVKNKLYLKKRGTSSNFYVYCFEPITYCPNILYPGNLITNPKPKIKRCVPDSGNTVVFEAPIKQAVIYNWTFAGTNGTIVPIGNGSSAKLILAANATGGILSVIGTNDCGLASAPATLNVIVNQKPVFSVPNTPQIIKCNPDSTLLPITTSNSFVSIWWRNTTQSSIISHPFYTKIPGSFYAIVQDNSNNCKDSAIVSVINFKQKPNAKITSHNYFGATTPVDTVTCLSPTVIINAASDSAGVVVNWKSIATNSVYSNPVNLSAQNYLKVIATRTLNNCVDSSIIVLVNEDKIYPNVQITTPSPTINCSYVTTTLNANFSPSNCTAIWTSSSTYSATNPFISSNGGKHIIKITNPINGCVKKDSLMVIREAKIILNSTKDTTICKHTPATLNTLAAGNIPNVVYSWGATTVGSSITVTPSVNSYYVVSATGPNGCTGKDTIKVIISPDIQDSILTYKSCSDNVTGTIVMFASGGLPPYKYSINNGTSYFYTNTFSNLLFGNYNVVIKDSLGCLKNVTTVLNPATSYVPSPKFLASTQNYVSDTIVLVDISIPKSDSVHWLLPNQASIIGGNMFSPIVAVTDTGAFSVTMQAFYNNCMISVSKNILFSPLDSLHATYKNANGIKTCSLFPSPNNGQFTVFVEFYKKQNVCLQVWDTSPNKQFQQNFYDVDTITLPIDLIQLQNGTYLLRVIGEYDSKNKPFIISK